MGRASHGMEAIMPPALSVPFTPVPSRSGVEPYRARSRARRIITVVLGIWAMVGALLAAVVCAVLWDLRP